MAMFWWRAIKRGASQTFAAYTGGASAQTIFLWACHIAIAGYVFWVWHSWREVAMSVAQHVLFGLCALGPLVVLFIFNVLRAPSLMWQEERDTATAIQAELDAQKAKYDPSVSEELKSKHHAGHAFLVATRDPTDAQRHWVADTSEALGRLLPSCKFRFDTSDYDRSYVGESIWHRHKMQELASIITEYEARQHG